MHLKTDKVDLTKKDTVKKNCIFSQSTHQVDMKNGFECYKDFFCYFNALKTNCVTSFSIWAIFRGVIHVNFDTK